MSKNENITNYVKSLSAEEIVFEFKRLCKLFPIVREYYEMRLNVNAEDDLLVRYRNIVKKEFMPERGFGKARLGVARKAVNDFIKISQKETNKADIMVYYVEMGVEFTNAYGDISEQFYTSMENMFDDSLKFISENNLQDVFRIRLEKIIKDTDGIGYGFPDTLGDMLKKYFKEII